MNMIPRLRTVALLMLLAGLALGIFATRAVRALTPSDPAAPSWNVGHPRIDQLVEMYRAEYHLNPQQADLIRQELLRHDRRVRDRLLALRQQYAIDFDSMRETVETNVDAILREAAESAPR